LSRTRRANRPIGEYRSLGDIRKVVHEVERGIVECPVLLDLHPNYIDAYSTLRPHSELS